MSPISTDHSDQNDVLTISVEELRARHLLINGVHDQLRTRVLALTTIVLGFSTYTYTTFHSHIPKKLEGRFLLLVCALSLCVIIYYLIAMISSKGWTLPMDRKLIPSAYQLHGNKTKYLAYVQDEYLAAINDNTDTLEKFARYFNRSLYLLIVSVILVVVLKEGANL